MTVEQGDDGTTVYLDVVLENGEHYLLPALSFAEQRAKELAELDAKAGANYEEVYANELAIGLNDNDEIYDYVANETNWSDVKDKLIKLPVIESMRDYNDLWGSSELTVTRLSAAEVARLQEGKK